MKEHENRLVFFEEIRLLFLPFALWYLLLGYSIISFHQGPGYGILRRFARAIRSDRVQQIDPSRYDWLAQIRVNNQVFHEIETVYSEMMQGDPLPKVLEDLYHSSLITNPHRKILAKNLRAFYHFRVLARQLAEEQGGTVLWVPCETFLYFYRISVLDSVLRNAGPLRVPGWTTTLLSLIYAARRIAWFFAVAAFPLYMLGKIGIPSLKRDTREEYPVGVRIYRTDLGLRQNSRSIDFLLAQDCPKAKNTLFCIETEISKEYRQAFSDKGYCTADLRKILRHASIWFLRDAAGREIGRAWGHAALGVMRSRPPSARLAFEILRNFMVWTAFLTRYHLRHYVAYNDTVASDTARNILLHQASTETWYYLHTCANTDLYTPPGEEDLQDVEFSYLHFTHLVAWGEKSAKFYRSVPNFIGSYEITGCLWSEFAARIRDQGLQNTCLAHAKAKFTSAGGSLPERIIGVFDTSLDPGHPPSLSVRDMHQFLNGILRLLDDLPSIGVIFKNKRFLSDIAERSPETLPLYHALQDHPRCYLTDEKDPDPAETIAAADLVISACFSSPAIEALGARCRAFYYDATDRFRGTYYDQFPGFIAHDYDHLADWTRCWLYETSDEEFSRFLDTYIRGEVEAGIDGAALSRFRSRLCS